MLRQAIKSVTTLVLMLSILFIFPIYEGAIERVYAAEYFKLNVPLLNQNTDNPSCNVSDGRKNVGCATTSTAMVFNYYGMSATPETVYAANYWNCTMNWGSLNFSRIQTKDISITFEDYNGRSFDDIRARVREGYPVIIGSDNYSYTGDAHWVVIVGLDGDQFIVNNPRGTQETVSKDRFLKQYTTNQAAYAKLYKATLPTSVGGAAAHAPAATAEFGSYPVTIKSNESGRYLVAENGGGSAVNANRSQASGWESFTIVKTDRRSAGIRTMNGNYLGAFYGGGDYVYAYANNIYGWETWRINYHDYTLRSNVNWIQGWENFEFVPVSGWDLRANATSMGNNEKFAVARPGDGTITLRSYNGPLLQTYNGGDAIAATSFNVGNWEKFREIDRGNGRIALQSVQTGRYLSARGGASGVVRANQTNITNWEEFEVIKTSDGFSTYYYLRTADGRYLTSQPGKMGLKTYHRSYLQAVNGGCPTCTASADGVALDGWETFTMAGVGSGYDKVSFKSMNNYFLAAENGGGNIVNANRTAAGAWETFTVVPLGGNKVALRTYNGTNYLTANQGKVTFEAMNGSRYMGVSSTGYKVDTFNTTTNNPTKWTVSPR